MSAPGSVPPPPVKGKRASIEPLLEEALGFDKVFQRTASILMNLSERSMMKVLHVHCGGGRLGYYLGNSTMFDITGASSSQEQVNEAKSQLQYKDTALVELKRLGEEFRPASFQIVVCLHPPTGSVEAPSIQDLLRVATESGFVLVGAREDAWEAEGLMDEVQGAESGGGDLSHTASLLSMQIMDTGSGTGDASARYMMALLRKKT